MDRFYEIQLDSGAKMRAAGDDSLGINLNDLCLFRKDFYIDSAKVVSSGSEQPPPEHKTDEHTPRLEQGDKELPRIQRKVTPEEAIKLKDADAKNKSVLHTTQNYVEHLKLPMKLINAHTSFDGKLIIIQFSSDGRVDFRELVKQLSQEFNTRIELRQIGVRDETAIIGGISTCGRPMCCCAFLKDFASINVKMAKEQDLSLTPSNISGICGRLKCCLKYEHEGYIELDKSMPRRGDICECKEGRGRIVDRNLLSQKVVVHLDNTTRSVTYPKDEVTVVYPDKYKVQKKDSDDGKADGGED